LEIEDLLLIQEAVVEGMRGRGDVAERRRGMTWGAGKRKTKSLHGVVGGGQAGAGKSMGWGAREGWRRGGLLRLFCF